MLSGFIVLIANLYGPEVRLLTLHTFVRSVVDYSLSRKACTCQLDKLAIR